MVLVVACIYLAWRLVLVLGFWAWFGVVAGKGGLGEWKDYLEIWVLHTSAITTVFQRDSLV